MKTEFDYIVVGAGPAGLQAGYGLQKNKRDYLILDSAKEAGAFFKKYPRHKKLISINKVYTGFDDPDLNLRWDWNSLLCDDPEFRFSNISKKYFPASKDMVTYLNAYAEKYQLNIRYQSKVKRIQKDEKGFLITLSSGDVYRAKRVIMATGVSKPFVPDIPGVELAQCYTKMSLNKEDYTNKRVLIIGKGNSGMETADHLIEHAALIHVASPHPVKMAWKTHYVGHMRAVNNNFLDTYQLKAQNALINGYIDKIEHNGEKYQVTFAYTLANDEVEPIPYDAVLLCTGFRFDADVFDDTCMPELRINDRFPAQTSHHESVNVKDLYFAGTIMQERDFKKKQSGFVHGFRYNVDFLVRYLNSRYHAQPIAHDDVHFDAKAMTAKVIQCVNQSSALWQQTGFIGDAMVRQEGRGFRYYHGLPVEYVLEPDVAGDAHVFVMTLEFGQDRIDREPDTFAIERVHKDDYAHADESTGIHPIVRHYQNNQLLSEHHLIEDFDSAWAESVHEAPLLEYFTQELAKMKSEVVATKSA